MRVETEMEKYRAETFATKEPETIAWIDSFQDGDLFYDIGANVGVYSLYAAGRLRHSIVYSFEPCLYNYTRLLFNVAENGFAGRVFPLPFALGEGCRVSRFMSPKLEVGSSGGQVGRAVDEQGKEFQPAGILPVFVFSLDLFLLTTQGLCPNHVKVDIDGQEERVLRGMAATLNDPELKSILIELNPESANLPGVFKAMQERGFTTENPFNKMENHSRVRRAKEGIKAENWVFTREQENE